MSKKKWYSSVDLSLVIMSAIALAAGFACYLRGVDVFLSGLDAAWSMLTDVVPRLVAATFLAGFVEVLTPKQWITKWMGQQSGLKGIVIATAGGVFTPGGPMVSFPLIAALHKMGTDIGALVAYLTSWAVLGAQRVFVWEIPLMGMRFAALRFGVSLLLPLIAGLTARRLAGLMGVSGQAEAGS
jgi:uncharacterized membrane protein YraQ (UPF0718 family)